MTQRAVCDAWWEPKQHWPNGFQRVARRDRREWMHGLERELTRETKYLLKLRYARDLEFRQIGILLDRTENSVIQMHKRILEHLRERLATVGITKLKHIL